MYNELIENPLPCASWIDCIHQYLSMDGVNTTLLLKFERPLVQPSVKTLTLKAKTARELREGQMYQQEKMAEVLKEHMGDILKECHAGRWNGRT